MVIAFVPGRRLAGLSRTVRAEELKNIASAMRATIMAESPLALLINSGFERDTVNIPP